VPCSHSDSPVGYSHIAAPKYVQVSHGLAHRREENRAGLANGRFAVRGRVDLPYRADEALFRHHDLHANIHIRLLCGFWKAR